MATKYFNLAKKFMSEPREVQEFEGSPVFLNSAALSGFFLKRWVGFNYSIFLFRYKDNQAQMNYLIRDIDKFWAKFEKKIDSGLKYFKKLRALQERKSCEYEHFFMKFKQLETLNDQTLLKLFKQSVLSMCDGVGVAHVIEPISWRLGQALRQEIETQKIAIDHKTFSLLTAAVTPTFMFTEQRELQAIKHKPLSVRAKYLAQHAKKYFWVDNTYLGAKNLTAADFAKKLKVQTIPTFTRNRVSD